jgi:hypothetical protein
MNGFIRYLCFVCEHLRVLVGSRRSGRLVAFTLLSYNIVSWLRHGDEVCPKHTKALHALFFNKSDWLIEAVLRPQDGIGNKNSKAAPALVSTGQV